MKSKRKPTRTLPSVEYLRQCFSYNRKNGVLRWRERPREHFVSWKGWRVWNGKYARTIVGVTNNSGYRIIAIKRRRYLAHRIIYKLMIGKEPPPILDHKNRNPDNNAWKNIRTATEIE